MNPVECILFLGPWMTPTFLRDPIDSRDDPQGWWHDHAVFPVYNSITGACYEAHLFPELEEGPPSQYTHPPWSKWDQLLTSTLGGLTCEWFPDILGLPKVALFFWLYCLPSNKYWGDEPGYLRNSTLHPSRLWTCVPTWNSGILIPLLRCKFPANWVAWLTLTSHRQLQELSPRDAGWVSKINSKFPNKN